MLDSVIFSPNIFKWQYRRFNSQEFGTSRKISNFLYKAYVKRIEILFEMEVLIEEKRMVHHFEVERFATNVTFIQSYYPNGSLQEGKR